MNVIQQNYKLIKKIKNTKKLKKKINTITNWYGMANQVIPKRIINDKDIILLSKSINHIINRYYPKITKLSDYLLNIATICNNLNIPINWSLPTGLQINQSYISN